MKVRWIVLGLVGLLVVATWGAAAVAYFFFKPSLALWTALVTAAALSLLEGLIGSACLAAFVLFVRRTVNA